MDAPLPWKRKRRRPWRAVACAALLLGSSPAHGVAKPLCVPPPSRRAYVTALMPGDHILGVRVLAHTLKLQAGAHADIVVLVWHEQANTETVAALEADGLQVLVAGPEPAKARSGVYGASSAPFVDAYLKSQLWDLSEYDRVAYLSPASLAMRNADALFTCDGFCASASAGAAAPGDDVAVAALLAGVRGGGAMVLEPSAAVHAAMQQRLEDASAWEARQLDFASLVRAALPLRSYCAAFNWVDDFLQLKGSSGGGSGGGGGGGGALVLNAAHMPLCRGGSTGTSRTCYSLPAEYDARSESAGTVTPQSLWGSNGGSGTSSSAGGDGSRRRLWADEPLLMRFAAAVRPWDAAALSSDPLAWHWQRVRATLREPYASPRLLLLLLLAVAPCVLLLAASAAAAALGVRRARSDSKDGAHGERERRSSTAAALAASIAACAAPAAGMLPTRVRAGKDAAPATAARAAARCCMGTAAAAAWYAAAAHCSAAALDPFWHPALAQLVYHIWLACGVAAGISLAEHWRRRRRQQRRRRPSRQIYGRAPLPVSAGLPRSPQHALPAATTLWVVAAAATAAAAATLTWAMLAGSSGAAAVPSDSDWRAWRRATAALRLVGALRGTVAVAALVGPAAAAAARSALQRAVAPLSPLTVKALDRYRSHRRRPLAAALRSAAVSAVLHQWDWLLAAAALCWVVAPLAWELRRAAAGSAAEAARSDGGGDGGLAYYTYSEHCLLGQGGSFSSAMHGHLTVPTPPLSTCRRLHSCFITLRAGKCAAVSVRARGCCAPAILPDIAARANQTLRYTNRRQLPPHLVPLLSPSTATIPLPRSVRCGAGRFLGAGAGGPLAPACGARETFRAVITAAAGAVCFRAGDGRYLSPRRGALLDKCAADAQFLVTAPPAAAPRGGGGGGSTGGWWAKWRRRPQTQGGEDGGARGGGGGGQRSPRFCLLNPASGLYLSASHHPQPLCRRTEQWQVMALPW
ncbi:hypothetical protein JKP88DRAFT_251781 [Tribonema minus]|uniref:Uncharacterized protein n=1 Tax=Tribonema minus TaxID=303371 RepID=A0A835ZFA1_9STRA|nr:hypothetical protein JKP88DRAFT_251781 [Tribonema minus]